ncbi:unnamed protein product [Leptidea sinapis]|uniref:Uncharacterized protein n=1 Tax=Leptidea sinapis TaxID=189913 RepID=A0A5E4QJP0_9NEOP|nr:unnamed protein product [Leptidea sinapis]
MTNDKDHQNVLCVTEHWTERLLIAVIFHQLVSVEQVTGEMRAAAALLVLLAAAGPGLAVIYNLNLRSWISRITSSSTADRHLSLKYRELVEHAPNQCLPLPRIGAKRCHVMKFSRMNTSLVNITLTIVFGLKFLTYAI